MFPYKTEPILIRKIWGGYRLLRYNKRFSGKVGESIEFDGEKYGVPLVIKLIDAWDNLSIQVHPDKETAVKMKEGLRGKDELWFVLDCDEDSYIYCGFNDIYEKKMIREAALDGTIVNMLNKISVRKGDCIYVPSGTVHALGKGVMVYELQQASDLTYRLYDWDRTENGKKRKLHIKKALQSIKVDNRVSMANILNVYDKEFQGNSLISMGEYKHFRSSFVVLKNEEEIMQVCDKMKIVTIISGKGYLRFNDKNMIMRKGDTIVIPKASDTCATITGSGLLRYIESSL